MLRVVLDTNLLVAAAYSPTSASRTILEACLSNQLELLVSRALRREYDLILKRALRATGYEDRLAQALAQATPFEPTSVPRVVPDDPDDDKLIALASQAKADALVTNDQHLLSLPPYQELPILQPSRFVEQFLTPKD